MSFLNRKHAGHLLSERILELSLREPLVLALPRGGVPIGREIAKALGAPLDVLVVRKVGTPGYREFGIGAVTENNEYWIDPQSIRFSGARSVDIEEMIEEERIEMRRRVQLYRGNRPLPRLRGRSIIVVDDGLATGVTARVACAYLKSQGAVEVILAVPVAAPEAASSLRSEVSRLICLEEPDNFRAVGQFYEEFEQLEDREVLQILEQARQEHSFHAAEKEIKIKGPGWELSGFFSLPVNAHGLVIFAHGSGSSRLSPRNQQVARALQRTGIATLLFDLLTPSESLEQHNIFDIPLLGQRLLLATQWAKEQSDCSHLPIGFFGASTGAGAALWAAAESRDPVAALVSRGGRPDLAGDLLKEVAAPTLLLVGEHDKPVIDLTWAALEQLRNGKILVIPGATHLFEEPGALERVEEEAAAWFLDHFSRAAEHAVA